MSAIIAFSFEGTSVRGVQIDGEPWFVGKDVANILGYSDTDDAIRRHCKHLKMLKPGEIPGLEIAPRGMGLIPEPDLYRLIMRSKLPSAERFEEWVVGEVLPSLRKTGRYAMPGGVAPPPLSPLDLETAREWVGIVERVNQIAGSDAARTVLERSPLLTPMPRPSTPRHETSPRPAQAKAAPPKPAEARESHSRQPDSATLEYRQQADAALIRFLQEKTMPKPGARVPATELHDAYTRWCLERKVEPLSGNGFGRACRRHKIRWIKSCGVNHYTGIQLTAQQPATLTGPTG